MIKAENLKLISGIFSTDEASTILLGLLKNKIDFHNMEIAHIKETGSGNLEKSEHRIKELKLLREEIRLIIEEAKHEKVDLAIESTINIHPVQK
ncbi:hypothetical protein SAMN05661096_00474 [Marivirga sericea]|uniref:Uncharacterized protein n=1 Tax=Marivirga sericea TaxID=1028 RepID=A0A1X7ICY6_9BACT|nr:hypothetical protein [Marivirga sericea]SMG12160.1 hypothetical protein SAMN05661096_00474 [Marivirga sericea]